MEKVTHKTQALVGDGFRTQWVNREMIKDDKFQDSHKLAVEQSNLATRETNDCVVRAFASALDISYDSAHGWVKRKFSRKFGKGTYTSIHIQKVLGKVKNGYNLKHMVATRIKGGLWNAEVLKWLLTHVIRIRK